MATYVIGGIVFLLMGLAIYSMVKAKKSGKSGCGCGCDSCGAHCHDHIK